MTMSKGSENVPANILVESIREQIETARKYKMSYAEVVGVLEMIKIEVIDEAKETLVDTGENNAGKYEAIRDRLISDLAVDVPGTGHFGRLIVKA